MRKEKRPALPKPRQVKRTLREVFEAELAFHGLSWCRGGAACTITNSHKRGFVANADKNTIHLDSEIATRSSLHRGLHEIGHAISDETGMRRFEREANAEKYATTRMRELGISVPRKAVSAGKRYVKRMKRWGNNIKKARS